MSSQSLSSKRHEGVKHRWAPRRNSSGSLAVVVSCGGLPWFKKMQNGNLENIAETAMIFSSGKEAFFRKWDVFFDVLWISGVYINPWGLTILIWEPAKSLLGRGQTFTIIYRLPILGVPAIRMPFVFRRVVQYVFVDTLHPIQFSTVP